MTDVMRVRVAIATVWTGPEAPRDLDKGAVADEPDVTGWLTGLRAEDRLGLHGRTLTQLLVDEPVLVDVQRDGWAHVVAPWQPVPGTNGYEGWVRESHLRA